MPRALHYDRKLCATVIGLTCFGLLMVFSVTTASSEPTLLYTVKQSAATLMGLIFMRYLMLGDYHEWRSQRVVFAAVGCAIILLIAAFVFGTGQNTSRFLRVGHFSFQPSEAAKLALILFLAYYLESFGEKLESVRALIGAGLIFGVLCLLVLGGRDLGTMISMMVIAAAILFAAGLRMRYFIAGGVAAIPLVAWAVLSESYRMKRLTVFHNPEADPLGAGYQLVQSKIAVGSGGVLGQGLMLGRAKMRFLPEAHTDFIFAMIGEEVGLIGCLLVIAAFGFILWRGLRTALRAPDNFGRYLAVGVTAMIVCQAMINMGVVLALLPTKGMPLPFISYGGTAMMTSLAGAGLLLNVSQYAE